VAPLLRHFEVAAQQQQQQQKQRKRKRQEDGGGDDDGMDIDDGQQQQQQQLEWQLDHLAAALRDLHTLLAPCPWATPLHDNDKASSTSSSASSASLLKLEVSVTTAIAAPFPPSPSAATAFRARLAGPLRRLLCLLPVPQQQQHQQQEEGEAAASEAAAAAAAVSKWHAAQSLCQLAGLSEAGARRFLEEVGASAAPASALPSAAAAAAAAEEEEVEEDAGRYGGGMMAAGGYRPLHPYLVNIEGVLLARNHPVPTASNPQQQEEGVGGGLILTPSTREKLRALAVELAAADDAAYSAAGGVQGVAGACV
jgi:hypothetical protein